MALEESNEFHSQQVREYHEKVISEGGQESTLTAQELDAKSIAMKREREAIDNDRIKSMEKHPRCALLPSPEKLDESIGSPCSDKTDTIKDFTLVKDWVRKEKLLNTGFYVKEQPEQIETPQFGSLVTLAFNNAFAAMRNTFSPELDELVFWYYAGHGLGKETAKKMCYSSTPCLSEVGLDPNPNDPANKFVKENRKVQGGELCLHKVGVCDLYGLLKPWIAAVKAESTNAQGAKKKNKHLVIILDSCHSGIIAEELGDCVEQAQGIDPTLLDENSVTIQAACGPDERTFGGYFTPCFVYLNDHKNDGLLNELKDQWEKMGEEEKTKYRSIDLPSPMVVTTRPQSAAQPQAATIELEVQGWKLTLFQDPVFFKFCSIKVYQHQDNGKERVLDAASANAFMSTRNFTVLDYKLKKLQSGPYSGTPMGLFLLEDPSDQNMSVCAHIHFKKDNTKQHTRINLVHHKKPPMGSTSFIHEEDHGKHIKVPLDNYAKTLVQKCKEYVTSKEPGRWEDATRWNMTFELGVNGTFRQQERSAWEESYLEYIKQFDLPKVNAN